MTKKYKYIPRPFLHDHYFTFYENGLGNGLDEIRKPSLGGRHFGLYAYIYAFFYNHSIKNKYFNRLVVVNKSHKSFYQQIKDLIIEKTGKGKKWQQE